MYRDCLGNLAPKESQVQKVWAVPVNQASLVYQEFKGPQDQKALRESLDLQAPVLRDPRGSLEPRVCLALRAFPDLGDHLAQLGKRVPRDLQGPTEP